MAAKKKSSSKEQTWVVTSNGQEFNIEAHTIEVTDSGALIFRDGSTITRAYADNGWTSVDLADEEQQPA